jgi:hypothetical protein
MRGFKVKNNHVISLSFAENIPKNPIWKKLPNRAILVNIIHFLALPTQIDVIYLAILNYIFKSTFQEISKLRIFFKRISDLEFSSEYQKSKFFSKF